MWNKKERDKKEKGRNGRSCKVSSAKLLALVAAATVLLVGCSGKEDDIQQPSATGETAQPKAGETTQSTSTFTPNGDCVLASEKEEAVLVKAAADGSVQEVTVETEGL